MRAANQAAWQKPKKEVGNSEEVYKLSKQVQEATAEKEKLASQTEDLNIEIDELKLK